MRLLSVAELLSVWERGQSQQPVQRALTLLAAACPETPPDALAQLRIGERDARLLTLREWTFGSQLAARTRCPACGEHLDLVFQVGDIQTHPEHELEEPLVLNCGDDEICFRLPNSLDLAAISGGEDVSTARQRLLERCLVRAAHSDRELSAGELPAAVAEAIAARMAEADPQADVQLALSCPQCDHRWQATFDIVSFFWCEINAWAVRLLEEVHMLASAYGWREADILALSPTRRQAYLDMVRR